MKKGRMAEGDEDEHNNNKEMAASPRGIYQYTRSISLFHKNAKQAKKEEVSDRGIAGAATTKYSVTVNFNVRCISKCLVLYQVQIQPRLTTPEFSKVLRVLESEYRSEKDPTPP